MAQCVSLIAPYLHASRYGVRPEALHEGDPKRGRGTREAGSGSVGDAHVRINGGRYFGDAA